MTEAAKKLGQQPAYPCSPYSTEHAGLSKREQFAKAAMQALVGHSVEDSEYLSAFDGQESRFDKWIGNRAVEIAEATIEALAAREL